MGICTSYRHSTGCKMVKEWSGTIGNDRPECLCNAIHGSATQIMHLTAVAFSVLNESQRQED